MNMLFMALPVSGLYCLFGVLAGIIAVQHYKKPELRDCSINDFIMSFIYFFCAFTYPFMYAITGLAESWQTIFFLLTGLLIFTFYAVLFCFIGREMIRAKRDPSIKMSRGYREFVERSNNFEYSNKRDNNRKLLHLIPVVVILLFHYMSVILKPFLDSNGISPRGFAYFLIVLVGYAFVAMFMLAESFRLISENKYFHLTPDWAHKWFGSSLKPAENQAFISSIPVVLCLMPFLFGPFPIFVSVAFVESISDAMASLIGKRFGKHKLGVNPKKSWEGLLAGGASTFLLVVLANFLFPELPISMIVMVIMAIGTAIVFMAIDMFAKRIMDNILNPLVCGGFMIVFLALLAPVALF
ncbi:MAG TPA: phosphatidate cytidylyltransferase [Candidatus Lokiarchaeia archaeon]|nr:phosphatidate cytidylyltransferase [Candidatus Lokiarchaeia archaeon]